ncbi:MAG: YdcF family protein [Verrucomicrobia bacterium]|nr:YdcF family protein [Verrucomicrobiota bacterium]
MSRLSLLAKTGLIRKKEAWCITVWGWLLILFCAAAATFGALHAVFPFLAQNDPVRCELLIVEGWIPDYHLPDVKAEFEEGRYKMLVLTGAAILKGQPFAEFKTFPELTRAILVKQGWDETKVVAVPCGDALRDRTYASALALKQWLADSQRNVNQINIYSMGAHARRTRLLYEKAFDGKMNIGIIAGRERRFDGRSWWKTSEGVRTVLDEAIAYFYARFLFRPSNH